MSENTVPKYLDNDENCVLRAQNGEYDALRVLYERHYQDVMQYVCSKVDEIEDAKDIVSKAFTKVIDHIENLKKPDCFQKWLYVIVNNQIKDYYKSRPSEQGIVENDPTDDDADRIDNIPSESDNPMYHSVYDVMKQLSPKERQLFHLKSEWGLSYAEISKLLGKSEPTVRKMVERVRSKFRRLYLQKYKSPVYSGGEKND